MATFCVETLGCKANFAESASIERELMSMGFSYNHENPDFVVINSCAVTRAAEFDSKKLIKRWRKKAPQAKIILTGCYAQYHPQEVKNEFKEIIIVGNNFKETIPRLLNIHMPDKDLIISHYKEIKNNGLMWGTLSRTRYFIKIQDGCDYFCSYCIIPFLRGRSRSVPPDKILDAVEEIISKGGKEIVLTGINVGCYGLDMGTSLRDLLILLSKTGIQRLRISSIEPDLITKELVKTIGEIRAVMPHFHIPIQSGSDRILKLMGRRYTVEQVKRVVNMVVELISDCSIGMDVITGFPGESDEDFENTYRLLEELPVAYLHVFTYSERMGTKAVRMAEPVPQRIRKERTRLLRELSTMKRYSFYGKFTGRTFPVLFEEQNRYGEWEGWTPNYIKVAVPSNRALRNEIAMVKLTNFNETKNSVEGIIVN